MRVCICNAAGDDFDSFSHKDAPIPRIGERVFLGYTPGALVLDVIYNYEAEKVLVITDGIKGK